jgi:hypothetical protein
MRNEILHFIAILGLTGCTASPVVPVDGGMEPFDATGRDVGGGEDSARPVDSALVPDGGPLGCTSDDACADGAGCATDCTVDTCVVASGSCRHTVTPALCAAGESCNAATGCCEAGRPCADDADCEDMDACTTTERCDPAARVCTFVPLDGDADGDPPRVCGGGDCNDADPNVFAGADERCNGGDDDCDTMIDEGADSACGDRRVCVAGTCECSAGFTDCFGTCDDPMTSPSNCGMCGQSCGSGTCSGGACRCAAGQAFCGASGCVDVSSEDAHCGACDSPCDSFETCATGSCVGCDAPGSPCCGGTSGYCATGLICTAGTCASCGGWGEPCCSATRCSSFPYTLTCVADTCEHCGELREPCCAGRSPSCYFYACSGGFCGGCMAPYTVCDGLCVDTEREHDHCGACGNACGASELCSAGTCIPCGAEGSICCGTTCGAGLACITNSSFGGTCRRAASCSPTAQTGCRAGEACYRSSSDGTLYCAPAGTGAPGAACTDDTDCAPGSGCDIRGRVCRAY